MPRLEYRTPLTVAALMTVTACGGVGGDADASPKSPVTLATFVGGSGLDDCDAITVDRIGNIFLGCHIWSTNFPGLPPGSEPRGDTRAAVVKLDPHGEVTWTRLVDGTHWDGYFAITTDSAGNVYAAGAIASPDLPTSEGVLQRAFGGEMDCLITKLGPDGDLVFTTYLGGGDSDSCSGIAVDGSGAVYVAGGTSSPDFPTAGGSIPSGADSANAFVAKLSADGSSLAYSVLLGGEGSDGAYGLAIDAHGEAIVVGPTESTSFPTRQPLLGTPGGETDAFVARLDASGSVLWATYLGGSGEDIAADVAVDGEGNVYVVGVTQSEDFPLSSPLQAEYAGRQDLFLAKLSPDGSRLVYSTYLGGRGEEGWAALEVDSEGRAVLLVYTESGDYPIRRAVQRSPGGGQSDIVITKLNQTGAGLVYSTYYGGSENDAGEGLALGPHGEVYVSGWTHSVDFPLVGAAQPVHAGDWDVLVLRIVDPDTVGLSAESPPQPDVQGSDARELVDLGTLGGGTSLARAIDNQGQIVGESTTAEGERHAFLWTPDSGMQDLGTIDEIYSSAWDVSATGIVGQSTGPRLRPAFWETSGIVELPDLEGWYNVVASVNDSGQAAGWSLEGWSWDSHAVRWSAIDRAADLQDLGVLGAASLGLSMEGTEPQSKKLRVGSSRAWSINEAGAVAGESETQAGGTHAFLWTLEAGMADVGTLGGLTSRAFALSDGGVVVGESLTETGERHAFRWEAGLDMIDLGTLGGPHSSALGINSVGVVVGYSYTAEGHRHAFVWSATEGMRDLGTLGGSESLARGINDRGEIIGESLRADGSRRAVLWRPKPGQ